MNKKDILNEMGGISPEFIEEANEPVKKKQPLLKLAAAVASFAVICAAVAVPLSMRDTPVVGTEPTLDGTKPTAQHFTERAGSGDVTIIGEDAEIAAILKWDEMDDSHRFASIENDLYKKYHGTGKPIDRSLVGDFVTDVTAAGYDIYEDKTHTKSVAVYAIRCVDPSLAVLVKFDTLDDYYVFVNANQPTYTTLGELVNAFALSDHLTLTGTMHTTLHIKNISFTQRNYTLTKTDELRLLLLECTDAPLVAISDVTDLAPLHTLSFSVNCASTGQENVSITVNECGYLYTNIGWVGQWYFIGKYQTEKIIELAEKTSTLVKENVIAFDRPTPSTDPTYTSPAYDPNNPRTYPQTTSEDCTTVVAYTTVPAVLHTTETDDILVATTFETAIELPIIPGK